MTLSSQTSSLLNPLPDLKGCSVTVMGLGLFGGGVGVTEYLVRQGAKVTVTDLRSADQLKESIAALESLPIKLILGEHREQDFTDTDMVVVNPAVRPTSPFVALARDNGTPLTTETMLFLSMCKGSVIGVTGSNGKTTTTQLIGAMLSAYDNRTLVGGNMGGTLLDRVETVSEETPVVLELSSFQLDWLGKAGWSPHIAVVTNLSPNHLDWHHSLDDYLDAKRQIVLHQTQDDYAVLNSGDERLTEWADSAAGSVLWFKSRPGAFVENDQILMKLGDSTVHICSVEDVPLPGLHNRENVLAAVAAAAVWGVPPAITGDVIKRFEPIEHRLQLVANLGDVKYINDSIATTPESTIMALRSFDEPIVLIAGGYDKGVSYDGLGREIAHNASQLITIGATGKAIDTASEAHGMAEDKRHRATSLDEAVALATSLALAGSVVLLSPASASYDQFRHFAERGQRFVSIVEAIRTA